MQYVWLQFIQNRYQTTLPKDNSSQAGEVQ
jgi:hypothetical protein